MSPTSVLPVSIGYASFAEFGGHSIPGQRRHSSTPSWRRALITVTLYLPSHRRSQTTISNECLTLLPALSRSRRYTTADWHESCATSFIGTVYRSGSSLSSAPWCTAVYTTLLPRTSVTTACRSRMLPLACNYEPPAAIKLSFPYTTPARSAVEPSLSLAQRSRTHCQTSSATHCYRLTVSVASLKHSCLQYRSSVYRALQIFCWCAI